MTQQEQYADIVIVGGGMVGASMACALAELDIRVVLLEAGNIDHALPAEGFELRVSAITRASQRLFETMGVWPGIAQRRISPFRDMHVWDASGDGVIHFDSAEIGEACLGHIIENNVITAALYERLSAYQNIEVISNCQVAAITNGAENASLALINGKTINTRLIIAADGSRSAIRQHAGISVRGWDYDHSALVTWVKTELFHQETAWQRFLPTGPLAFLPLQDGYSSIVWSTQPDQAERLRTLDEAVFRTELEQAFASKLGKIESIGPRAAFPLRFFVTNEYVRPRLALIGDAAHTVHPLAGQGVNLGLSDVATLAEVLHDALQDKRDPGDLSVLRRYERWRRADSMSLLVTMDSLKRLFGSDVPVVRLLRNVGMNLTNRITPLKNNIVRTAMGMDGSLPRLSRGLPLNR
ncbi:MAG: UbiH/UbiF/VisC/COQ6 family ubiquinone biosynthesis hydroxylase [Gammaproteobacteria bacterium]|nr:UbiH/UbiF/VisC/COQ6 family ubiquinone biosynthesis hydroxylase [Gammaproteobacteria bacterium]MDH5652496.1 UbiH/UbiF/VisC/COQ6 family ubiquinone biosynthesis hydroxylase [Gammaproteobacteria bacterium]